MDKPLQENQEITNKTSIDHKLFPTRNILKQSCTDTNSVFAGKPQCVSSIKFCSFYG